VDAVIAHKGLLERLGNQDALSGKGVILHLNGMSTLDIAPNNKAMLTGMHTALLLGADAVSLQLNFDGANDRPNWEMLGQTVDAAMPMGLPVLTMLYDKVETKDAAAKEKRTRQLLRAAIELGTDAIKISLDMIGAAPEVLTDISRDALLFVAGGELADDESLLGSISGAVSRGAAGTCIGRNVFARRDPSVFLDRLATLVHQRALVGLHGGKDAV
jgi:class I fructose-bisphosphate aldolase/fructose-bisphosphate aldolase/2-amino-3,7-dideoxy-D-threo-hept-6-ulosonate synthase